MTSSALKYHLSHLQPSVKWNHFILVWIPEADYLPADLNIAIYRRGEFPSLAPEGSNNASLWVHVCCYLWHNSVLVDLVVLSDSCWGSHFSWSTYPVSAFTVINICIEFNVPKWCLSFPVFDDKQRLLLKTNRKDDLCRHFMNNLSCVWGCQHEGHSSPESYRIPREEIFFLRNIYIKNQRLYQ